MRRFLSLRWQGLKTHWVYSMGLVEISLPVQGSMNPQFLSLFNRLKVPAYAGIEITVFSGSALPARLSLQSQG